MGPEPEGARRLGEGTGFRLMGVMVARESVCNVSVHVLIGLRRLSIKRLVAVFMARGASRMRIQRLRKGLPFVLGRCTVCRSVSLLTFVALIIVGLPALSGAQPTCLPDGDVDQNGSVTAADALLAFQQALSLTQLSACQRSIADVFPQPSDPDGNITASDALCIFQSALSLPSCLDTLPSVNQPPVVDAGPDQSVDAGVMVFPVGHEERPGRPHCILCVDADGRHGGLTHGC